MYEAPQCQTSVGVVLIHSTTVCGREETGFQISSVELDKEMKVLLGRSIDWKS